MSDRSLNSYQEESRASSALMKQDAGDCLINGNLYESCVKIQGIRCFVKDSVDLIVEAPHNIVVPKFGHCSRGGGLNKGPGAHSNSLGGREGGRGLYMSGNLTAGRHWRGHTLKKNASSTQVSLPSTDRPFVICEETHVIVHEHLNAGTVEPAAKTRHLRPQPSPPCTCAVVENEATQTMKTCYQARNLHTSSHSSLSL